MGNLLAGLSRGTRAVKGAGFRSQCVVLRRFESCPLHQSIKQACIEVPIRFVNLRQEYPSGQRGSVQVAVRSASQVRILPPAPVTEF